MKDVDVYFTYDSMDWAVLIDKPKYGINGLEDILERMDEDVPEEGKGLNYSGSNDILLLHDMSELTDLFEPIIEGFLNKGLKFEIPEF